MLELTLLDGKKLYVPTARVFSVSEDAQGNLVAAVDNGGFEPQWHNISAFAVLREGQRLAV